MHSRVSISIHGVYRINHRDTAPVTRSLFIKRNYNFPPAERETSLRGPPLCPVHLLHQCCIRYPCFADVSEPGGTFTFVLDSKRRLSPWGCGLVRFSFVQRGQFDETRWTSLVRLWPLSRWGNTRQKSLALARVCYCEKSTFRLAWNSPTCAHTPMCQGSMPEAELIIPKGRQREENTRFRVSRSWASLFFLLLLPSTV